MTRISFRVEEKPPWKQSPADAPEKNRQTTRRAALQTRARATYADAPLGSPCRLQILHTRSGDGGPDAANIVGGIADALQRIVYKNDRQILEIMYAEARGPSDSYEVVIDEVLKST